MREFVGSFDDGGYVHLLFVPDDFEELAKEGLASVHTLDGAIKGRIHERAAELPRTRPVAGADTPRLSTVA